MKLRCKFGGKNELSIETEQEQSKVDRTYGVGGYTEAKQVAHQRSLQYLKKKKTVTWSIKQGKWEFRISIEFSYIKCIGSKYARLQWTGE